MKRIIRSQCFAAGLMLLCVGCAREMGVDANEHVVARQPVQVWSTYEGVLESRKVRNIYVKISGNATITELAPEGLRVSPGDVLVRFDSAQVERDLLRIEKEYALAVSELHSLTNAKLPLELRDLEMRILEAETTWAAESGFLEDSRALLSEGLISESEVRAQKEKVDRLLRQKENIEEQWKRTRDYLHPAAIDRAVTTLRAAQSELELSRGLLSNCVIRAEGEGMVIYKPLYVGGEQRTVRIGDSLMRNQPFMALPDMEDLMVSLDIPESELSRMRKGQTVTILPRAYPDLALRGRVEVVGALASSRGDRPAWQKFLRVVVALEETRPELRSGMSVLCRVLIHDEADALVVPRTAVRWEDRQASVRMRGGERRVVEIGPATEDLFVIRSGLQAGDRIEAP